MNQAIIAAGFFRRDHFSGRNDKYAPPSTESGSQPMYDLQQAIAGMKPTDVTGALFSDDYILDAVSRLARYRGAWRRYRGDNFGGYVDDLPKTNFNFCRSIVNKRAAWAIGRGFKFVGSKGNELVADLFTSVWKKNSGSRLVRRTSKCLLAAGDVFWYFSVRNKDMSGADLPKEQWCVRISMLNPSYVFPIWAENEPTIMRGVLIQFPILSKLVGEEFPRTHLFSMVITPAIVRTYIDQQIQADVANPLGLIPIVHIANDPVADSTFGHSALDDVIPFADAYNRASHAVSKIISYHSEPTTVILGGKLSDMQRGAGKVWSGLPENASIETLQLHDNLGASFNQLDRLEAHIYRSGKTPKISFDSEGLAISNTSGVALQLLFQPLVEATDEIHEDLSEAMRYGNEIVARIHERIFGEPLTLLADDPENILDCPVEFTSIIPKDEQVELDMAIKKKEARIWSQAELIRRFADGSDTARIALELATDKMTLIIEAYEKASALAGQVPNLSSVFVDSMFLNEDLLDIAGRVGNLSESSNGKVTKDSLDDE